MMPIQTIITLTIFYNSKKFGNWTSGNNHIDEFIKQTQLNATRIKEIIEWIPFDKFTNIEYYAKGGFGTVYKAVWTDGYINEFDDEKDEWIRKPQMIVCLKSLDNSKDMTRNFLKEVENQHKLLHRTAIEIYGITKNPNDHNYMMVMQYAKQGSLRQLLDRDYNYLKWDDKIIILYKIAKGLSKIHSARLMHKNFHSGNIVCDDIFYPYITDVGLCRPVYQNSISEEIYGVIPYIAPEVLYKKEYIQKSDIYSFGIIMSEVFTGCPPHHDIPHDKDLAIKICLGYRPEIRCYVPQLLLDVMNKCLDVEPQNRPTAEKLANTLNNFKYDLKNVGSKLYKQVIVTNSEQLSYQTHTQAIYISRLLNLTNDIEISKLQEHPKPVGMLME